MRSKYGVRNDEQGKRERTRDGILFASKREAERYQELRMLEKAGEIVGLALQPVFMLSAVGFRGEQCSEDIGKYRADFVYCDRNGHPTYEDVKGFDTPLSKWKRKHVKAQYGIDVVIVR